MNNDDLLINIGRGFRDGYHDGLIGGRISPGMGIEAAAARAAGIPVADLTYLGEEPPDEMIEGYS